MAHANAGPGGEPGLRFIKRRARARPKVSLILLDWSVRESFHLLHYLASQDVPRDSFEVIIIEYHSRVSDAVRRFEEHVDTWVTLGMPEQCYYHKHLMYNAGIVLSRGEICVICDSDAMAKPTFIRTIEEAFARQQNIVLHMDQFRNNRKDFYPFNFPSFEDVQGLGCINIAGSKTLGVASDEDRIHARNYGACMCARRADLVAIGGADEHIDFLGHICGPYDMTFRLINLGRRELWHQSEFLYHTWHPGQDGQDNYLGPHDGRNISMTSLDALCTGRVKPLIENQAIRRLRENPAEELDALLDLLVAPDRRVNWQRSSVSAESLRDVVNDDDALVETFRGFVIYRDAAGHYGHPAVDEHSGRARAAKYLRFVEGSTLAEVRSHILESVPRSRVFAAEVANLSVKSIRAFNWLFNQIGVVIRRITAAAVAAVDEVFGSARKATSKTWGEGRLVGNLVPNLYYLGQAYKSGAPRFGVTILVQRRSNEISLRILAAAGLIPEVTVIHVAKTEQLGEILRNSPCTNVKDRLIMSRDLYLHGYHLIPPGCVGKQVITF